MKQVTEKVDSWFGNISDLREWRYCPERTFQSITNGIASGITSGIASGIASGLASGLASGIASGLANGIANGLANGIASGLTSGIASGFSRWQETLTATCAGQRLIAGRSGREKKTISAPAVYDADYYC